MLIGINKKILVYIVFFIVLGTLNNKNLSNLKIYKINQINISGLDEIENMKMLEDLNFLKFKDIFFLEKSEIKKELESNEIIESFTILKRYPSSIDIKINKTKFLAKVHNNGKIFLLGSNGNLISSNTQQEELPNIFGKYDKKEFFKIFNSIENSEFQLSKINNLYFFKSGRWDIETNSGIIIKLPKNDLENLLDLSSKIIKSNEFNKIKILDLRQSNQVIINGK
tara:strand:- start:709 stop:1383 length:675 start_codon:yes stop_codon:yes gene_type:complete